MNRNKRPGRTYVILKRALLITAILAFIEIIVLVVIHSKNTDKPVVKKQEKQLETSKKAVDDSPKAAVISLPETTVAPRAKDTIPQKNMVETVRPATPIQSQVQPKLQKDTPAITVIKAREIKTPPPVSNQKMFEILNEVRLKKLHSNNTAKCVSIQIVNKSNAENGFRIANYLRKNGYVITGREVVPGTQKGIQVDANEACIRLTIGTL